jgi:hypothetical protein
MERCQITFPLQCHVTEVNNISITERKLTEKCGFQFRANELAAILFGRENKIEYIT